MVVAANARCSGEAPSLRLWNISWLLAEQASEWSWCKTAPLENATWLDEPTQGIGGPPPASKTTAGGTMKWPV